MAFEKDGTGDTEAPTSDMLADVFVRQAELAAYYQAVRPDGFYSWPPQERCTTWTRAIVHECCELDNELNWKPWKNPRDLAANRDARLVEMADILHFFVQLALDQGFSAEEVYAAYIAKNQENRRRQQSDPRYQPDQPDYPDLSRATVSANTIAREQKPE
ncbi:MAG TPA: dUTPase [Ktedonobacterales bacterium]|nr:dUTPase [Ktedonobacterales bacterium]